MVKIILKQRGGAENSRAEMLGRESREDPSDIRVLAGVEEEREQTVSVSGGRALQGGGGKCKGPAMVRGCGCTWGGERR